MEFYAISNNIPVHISDTQKGETTILLLHGYLETLYIFTELEELLSKQFRVISLDLPGHGLSGSNKDINTMSFMAAVAKDVLDICKVNKAYVAGHSMGAYVALECFKYFPQTFEGLIMLNSTPLPDNLDKKREREREIDLIAKDKLYTLAQLSIPKMYAPINRRRMDQKIEETIENTQAHDPHGIIASIRGLIQREDNSEFMSTIKNGLLIFSELDTYVGPEIYNKIIPNYPQFNTLILPNCGHNSFIEEPIKCLQAIENFILID